MFKIRAGIEYNKINWHRASICMINHILLSCVSCLQCLSEGEANEWRCRQGGSFDALLTVLLPSPWLIECVRHRHTFHIVYMSLVHSVCFQDNYFNCSFGIRDRWIICSNALLGPTLCPGWYLPVATENRSLTRPSMSCAVDTHPEFCVWCNSVGSGWACAPRRGGAVDRGKGPVVSLIP